MSHSADETAHDKNRSGSATALEAAQAGALYAASLPERALRAMVGAASGLVRESARAAVPNAMKGTKLYELTVKKMLGFLVKDVGGLEVAPLSAAALTPPATSPMAPPPPADTAGALPAEAVPVGGSAGAGSMGAGCEGVPAAAAAQPEGSEFVVKKALGNALDIVGLATLHVSPLWVIAVFSDVVLGARTYLNALGQELKARGVIDQDAQFEGVDGLLQALQKVSGTMADNLDTPPVTTTELQKMVNSLRSESAKVDLTRLLPEAEIKKVWNQIQEAAHLEGRSPFEVSSAVAMLAYNQLQRVGKGAVGSVKVGFDLLNDNVVDYYLDSLAEIRRKGYYQTICEASGPYLSGLRNLFEPSRESYTEKVLKGKPLRSLWLKARSWCRKRRVREGA